MARKKDISKSVNFGELGPKNYIRLTEYIDTYKPKHYGHIKNATLAPFFFWWVVFIVGRRVCMGVCMVFVSTHILIRALFVDVLGL